ncbi:hypothetical protein ACSAZL_12710 [Methanosarcina sp. T3]|uniref:hypothetical protein n=1 Tax=Methanosarcina sp. T3 TaxID=3439062 RepID=UPI003F8562F1
MSEASNFNLQISLLERSETDRVLPRRNSGRTAYCRAAILPKRTAYCCDYIATTGKIYDFSVPRRNSGFRAATLPGQKRSIT